MVLVRINLVGRLASNFIYHRLFLKLVGIVWKCMLYHGLYMTVTAFYCDDIHLLGRSM